MGEDVENEEQEEEMKISDKIRDSPEKNCFSTIFFPPAKHRRAESSFPRDFPHLSEMKYPLSNLVSLSRGKVFQQNPTHQHESGKAERPECANVISYIELVPMSMGKGTKGAHNHRFGLCSLFFPPSFVRCWWWWDDVIVRAKFFRSYFFSFLVGGRFSASILLFSFLPLPDPFQLAIFAHSTSPISCSPSLPHPRTFVYMKLWLYEWTRVDSSTEKWKY